MHVDTVDTDSIKNNTFNGVRVETVDTSFELHCVS